MVDGGRLNSSKGLCPGLVQSQKRECREKRKKTERERERRQYSLGYMENLTQGLYGSRRASEYPLGGLERPGGKVSLAGFHDQRAGRGE